MGRRPSGRPTEAELEALSVLWRRGPSTVRQVHEALQADRQTTMTTTLKILQVMMAKSLVMRDESRPALYSPAVSQQRTQVQLMDDLVQRAFGGSARQLLVRAVESGSLSSEELREIRGLIDKARKGRKGV